METSEIRSLYAAFDLYPSYKGAATHIDAFSQVLFETLNPGILFTIGSNEFPEEHPLYTQIHFNQPVKNYLARANQFTIQLHKIIEELDNLQVCHYRDIWSGLAAIHSDVKCQRIFEVNGLPSIELKYRYPQVLPATLQKISRIEQECLSYSDLIITPSYTTYNFLTKNGLRKEKIMVIPNGAEIPSPQTKDAGDPEGTYLIYFGAMQPWQGVDVLLKAMVYLQDIENLSLLVCSSQHPKFSKPFSKLAEKLGINEKVIWKHQVEKEELNRYLQYSFASIAPLKSNERNISQGCAPLKILESMAANTLLIASDLPPVREIIQHNKNGILVRADRPAELARTVRVMLEHPEKRNLLAENGQETIREKFLWQQQKSKLKEIYESIYAL